MILWNVAPKMIEARYDGRVFEFAPNERKRIIDNDVCNHLIFKLKAKGLVQIPEDCNADGEKKALIDALKARWKSLDWIVRNHRTMNKEREAHKQTAEAPSEAVVEAAEEAQEILNKLDALQGGRISKVNEYLEDGRTARVAQEISESEEAVETKGQFQTRLKGRRPAKAKTSVVPSTSNP